MRKRKRVLFIDSNLINYFLASDSFLKKEIEMVPAVSGKEAIHLFRNNQFFDLVITEMTLPDMDGFDLLREIRKINPLTPFIAQTASIMDDLKRRCLCAGFNCFLEKPFSMKQLEREVSKCINFIHV
jgi:CheY-like chemotaxis protein